MKRKPPSNCGGRRPRNYNRGVVRRPRRCESGLAVRLVEHEACARACDEVFAQVLDVLAAERVAAVRAVKDALGTIQLHADARSGQRLDRRAEMAQQRLDFAPLRVAADRVVKDQRGSSYRACGSSGTRQRVERARPHASRGCRISLNLIPAGT